MGLVDMVKFDASADVDVSLTLRSGLGGNSMIW